MVSLETLKGNFRGIVSQPGDEDYSITRWSAAAEKNAKFVLFPKDTMDISLAVRFAVAQGLDLAIAGGKHGSLGQSSSEGGVVIDMGKFLDGVRVDPKSRIAVVEGGCCIAKLEEETIRHGLAAVTGVSSNVGVVGHLLGGGYGLSVGMHGLSVDNVVSATIIIADGSSVIANENENPDLFWAIRGGGSNFGVIAEVELMLHDQRPDAYVCDMTWKRDELSIVVNEINKWRMNQPTDETVCLLFVQGPSTEPVVAIKAFKIADQEAGEAAFKRFANLSPISHNPRQISWEKLCTMSEELSAQVTQRSAYTTQGAFVDQLRLPNLEKLWDEWIKLVTKTPASGSFIMFECYHCFKLSQTPVDAAAYACRTPDMPVLIGCCYPDPSAFSAERGRQDSLQLKNIIESYYASSAGGGSKQTHICGYPNYADTFATDTKVEDFARAVFGPNYPRLQRIKRKYDPTMVFNKWFPIHPADD